MELPPNTIIASGPVIIEDDKVLLVRERKLNKKENPFFMFPGGMVDDLTIPLEETAKREAKEEAGIDIEIIRPLRTLIVKRPDTEQEKLAVLVHYLATRTGEIQPGEDIVEWGWYNINNLPENCAPNVQEIIRDYMSEQNL